MSRPNAPHVVTGSRGDQRREWSRAAPKRDVERDEALGVEVPSARDAADAMQEVAEKEERAYLPDGPWPALPSVEEILGSKRNNLTSMKGLLPIHPRELQKQECISCLG